MTRHYKLEHGEIIEFNSERETVEPVLSGRLVGIIGCEGKTCFIFKNCEDYIRFYLDNDRKPVTRLLMLLVNTLTRISESSLTVFSVQGNGRGQSRLHMTLRAENDSYEITEAEAPFLIAQGAWIRNPERIRMVLTALGVEEVTENPDPEDVHTDTPENAGTAEGAVEETIEIDGLDSLPEGEESVSVSDTRHVVLARNHPVAVIAVKEDDIRDVDEAISQIGANSNITVIYRTFRSHGEAQSFLSGFGEAARYAWNCFFFPVTDIDKIRTVLEASGRADAR